MKHYHGIAGMSATEMTKFVAGRHILVSHVYLKDLEAASEFCSSFVLDNGAFTVWRSGGVMDVKKYIDWCYVWYRHPSFDWAIIPDIIEGSEEENDKLIDEWPKDIIGAPVWHMYESLGKLERLCKQYEVVCLGSSGGELSKIGSLAWWKKISETMEVCCDEHGRPLAKLHGLRMMDPDIFKYIPLSSADSSNAVQNRNTKQRFGMYVPTKESLRANVIADRIESFQSAPTWVRDINNQLSLFA